MVPHHSINYDCTALYLETSQCSETDLMQWLNTVIATLSNMTITVVYLQSCIYKLHNLRFYQIHTLKRLIFPRLQVYHPLRTSCCFSYCYYMHLIYYIYWIVFRARYKGNIQWQISWQKEVLHRTQLLCFKSINSR